MEVHNLMEEIVFTHVNDLFDEAKKDRAVWLTCSCDQCRLDTICYVLNRIQPRYIKSARGLAHTQVVDATEHAQLQADINRIAVEGMKQVLSSKRPHTSSQESLPAAPAFNFPTIVGRVLNGNTFEPVTDISVELLIDGERATPIDPSWENPCKISTHTPGTYTFWVIPVSAKNERENRVFNFEIRAIIPSFDEVHHYFELGLTSESLIRTAYNAEHSFIVPDIHLFPAEDELDSMND